MLTKTASSIAIVATILMGGPAQAQSVTKCGPRADILKQLATQYRENPVAGGLADNGGLLEVLASIDGSTWTALITRPDGNSCLVMSGETWQILPPRTVATLQR